MLRITKPKSILTILSVLLCFNHGQAQRLISYEKLLSYNVNQVDSVIDANGFGPFVDAKNGVDYYKVLYLTPYKHVDSLVQVSGVVVTPTNTTLTCAAPIVEWSHGTQMEADKVASRLVGRNTLIGIILAANGLLTVMPDYLGLGDSDSSVIIHPYMHAFSQGHTCVNALRAARELADTLGVNLNGQLFLSGYSQGGFATVATHKLIEEQFSSEFQITASVPMSGAYDFKETQVDFITSDSVYSTPSYLPYIMLGYHSVFDSLAQIIPDVTQMFKSPYDTLIPPLFYSKDNSRSYIDGFCAPVPKHMIKDSLWNDFINDSLHPVRMALAESHLLDWTPQAPIKLFYCNGDEQVTYLNSERAYDSWIARGAQQVFKEDFGNFSHNGCVQFAILGAKNFIDSYRDSCSSTTGISESLYLAPLDIYPNPASNELYVVIPPEAADGQIRLFDLAGKLIIQRNQSQNVEVIDISSLSKGLYLVRLQSEKVSYIAKVLIE